MEGYDLATMLVNPPGLKWWARIRKPTDGMAKVDQIERIQGILRRRGQDGVLGKNEPVVELRSKSRETTSTEWPVVGRFGRGLKRCIGPIKIRVMTSAFR
jgi:hypothetical protein